MQRNVDGLTSGPFHREAQRYLYAGMPGAAPPRRDRPSDQGQRRSLLDKRRRTYISPLLHYRLGWHRAGERRTNEGQEPIQVLAVLLEGSEVVLFEQSSKLCGLRVISVLLSARRTESTAYRHRRIDLLNWSGTARSHSRPCA